MASVNAYDDMDPNGSEISAQGYTACVYVLLEGVFLLLHVTGVLLPALFFYMPSSTSPFKGSEQIFLWTVAIGDVICSIAGLLGIWVGRNLVPAGWRNTGKMSCTLATLGTGLVLVWRSLVLVGFAPWAGIWLAFDGPKEVKTLMYVFVCAYIILCIFLVFVLARAFRQTVTDGLHLQKHLDHQATQEREYLLHHASVARQQDFHADGEHGRDHELEPEVFGIFPLAPTITIYALVVAIACCLGFLWLLFSGRTVGGWAFFAEHPHVNTTFWLEFFLMFISAATAMVGVLGCLAFAGIRMKHLPCTSDLAILCLLVFLFGSMLRYALLFAITGMTFLEKNTCGIYVHGIAQLAYYTPWSRASEYWLHCQAVEYFMLILTLGFCFLDGYLIWCTYKLWHFAQEWTMGEA